MNYWESQYCNLNRMILSFIGLWPFDNTYFATMRKVISILTLFGGIFSQLITLITNECTLEFVMTVLSFTCFSTIYTLKYFTIVSNFGKVKELFRWIQEDWDSLHNEKEIEILKERANIAKLLMKVFILIISPVIGVFLIIPLVQKQVPVSIELFIDQKKYYFLIVALINMHVTIGLSATIGSDTTFMFFVEHACSLFRITCYRIENIYDENIVYDSVSRKQYEVYRKVIDAIRMYRRGTEFIHHLTSTFSRPMFIFMLIGTASATLSLLRLSRAMALLDDLGEFTVMVAVMSGTFAYMFFINYVCQEMRTHSSRIHPAIYNSTWYLAPLSTQKALLVVMTRSIKPCVFTVGGIYVPSNEAFTTLCKWSMSFCTFLVSTQN